MVLIYAISLGHAFIERVSFVENKQGKQAEGGGHKTRNNTKQAQEETRLQGRKTDGRRQGDTKQCRGDNMYHASIESKQNDISKDGSRAVGGTS